jgi:Zn-dependent protease
MAPPMFRFLDLAFSDPLAYATIVFALVGSIVLHELGHALVATWEGDPTPKIRGHLTWNPVVHMGWISIGLIALMGIGWGMTPVDRRAFRHRRWGDVLVSFAGPAVNLFLAFVGALVLVLAARGGAVLDGPVVRLWAVVLEVNTLLFLFNMIPVPPLDGFGVIDGTFDLGEFGARVRQIGMIAIVVAVLVANSDAFQALRDHVVVGFIEAAKVCVGA